MKGVCPFCGEEFEGRRDRRICGKQACENQRNSERKRRRRGVRPTKRDGGYTDPLVASEFEAFQERQAERKAEVHAAMEERRKRWGDVSGRDVIRYMLRGIA